jgi:hypothetical protein
VRKVSKEMPELKELKVTLVSKVRPDAELKAYKVMWVMQEQMLLQVHKALQDFLVIKVIQDQTELLVLKVLKVLEDLKVLLEQVLPVHKVRKELKDSQEQMESDLKVLKAQQEPKVLLEHPLLLVHKAHKEIQDLD